MEALDKFPATARGRAPRYDYDTLLDGTIWSCKRGTDFTCKRLSFEQNMRVAAKERDMKLTVHNMPDADRIIIQARRK